jgi:hypothetical protein
MVALVTAWRLHGRWRAYGGRNPPAAAVGVARGCPRRTLAPQVLVSSGFGGRTPFDERQWGGIRARCRVVRLWDGVLAASRYGTGAGAASPTKPRCARSIAAGSLGGYRPLISSAPCPLPPDLA